MVDIVNKLKAGSIDIRKYLNKTLGKGRGDY